MTQNISITRYCGKEFIIDNNGIKWYKTNTEVCDKALYKCSLRQCTALGLISPNENLLTVLQNHDLSLHEQDELLNKVQLNIALKESESASQSIDDENEILNKENNSNVFINDNEDCNTSTFNDEIKDINCKLSKILCILESHDKTMNFWSILMNLTRQNIDSSPFPLVQSSFPPQNFSQILSESCVNLPKVVQSSKPHQSKPEKIFNILKIKPFREFGANGNKYPSLYMDSTDKEEKDHNLNIIAKMLNSEYMS